MELKEFILKLKECRNQLDFYHYRDEIIEDLERLDKLEDKRKVK